MYFKGFISLFKKVELQRESHPERKKHQRERDRENRVIILSSSGYSPSAHNTQHWSGLRPGAGDSSRVNHMSGRDRSTPAIFHCFPRFISSNWIRNGAARAWPGAHMEYGYLRQWLNRLWPNTSPQHRLSLFSSSPQVKVLIAWTINLKFGITCLWQVIKNDQHPQVTQFITWQLYVAWSFYLNIYH